MKHRTGERLAFTLVELIVVLVVSFILLMVGVATHRALLNSAGQEPAKRSLAVFITAQLDYHEMNGVWMSPNQAKEVILDLDVVSGGTPSTAETMVSMSTSFVQGKDRIAGAVRTRDGACAVWRSDEFYSDVEDFKSIANTGSCTGDFALNTFAGEPW